MTTLDELFVVKKSGNREKFDPNKIHRILEWAIEGYTGVSVSEIELNAVLKYRDGIPTEELHKALIESAKDLISLNAPNYQYVAARLLLYLLRKNVWGTHEEPSFFDFISKMVNLDLYDSEILDSYSKEEIELCDEKLDHERDYLYTYAGLQQMCDKYLIQNRSTKEIYETPQFAYMAMAMTLFSKYPKKTRLQYVFKCYDYFSKFKISLPTPILSGVRTPLKRYASCCLIDVDDNLNSLAASNEAVLKYTASRSGIGINFGRIRAINDSIRNGEIVHTGVIPFLKWFEACVKSCQQNGIRGGGATVNFPFWHKEIEDVITLKNNTKTGDNSVRHLDYCIGFSNIFYERFIESLESPNPVYITLFSPNDVDGLYDAWGDNSKFNPLYLKYEADPNIPKKQILVQELMSLFTKERRETARIYAMNVDHCNDHGSFKDLIKMTNLCVEITHVTKPLQHIDDPEAEIGICILSALNVLEIKSDAELEKVCEIIVRLLDELIDHQTYPVKAAENFTKNRRSLGVGITNLAALLAKNNLRYDALTSDAPNFVDKLMEKIQFNLLKASVQLAKEKGPCAKFNETKYADGVLPIDTYNKNLDEIVTRQPEMDWESLRNDILTYGLRHSTLTAMMPCESSSVVTNSTNGIEPIRKFMIYKSSKSGNLPFIVPGYPVWKNKYTLQFDMQNNIGYSNITAAIQKWTDMAISCMHYYNYEHYEDNKLPDSKLIFEFLHHYKMGNKTLYYTYTNDLDKQSVADDQAEEAIGCESGVCAI